jgi:predicted ATPase/tRNA A-37 threonylcarbamoyl transferase component Bud32
MMDDSAAQRRTRVGVSLDELSHGATITLDQHVVLDAQRRAQGVFSPRQLLQGQFEIIRKIGEGGMGQVYLARDLTLGRRVAIKTLIPELLAGGADKGRDLQQLRRDATATARLQHPHIVTLYQIGFEADVPYMVLEYLSGESLAAKLQVGALPPDRVREIMMQVADALTHAHAEGVIHRDLKPGNIFITEHGAAKVLDFGVAMFSMAQETLLEQFALADLSELERHVGTTSQVAGTPVYMAPEQLLGQEQDARVDLWACGVLLFEMLTGRLPYQSPVAAIMRPPPRLADHLGGLSPAWQALLERCLARDLSQRFPDAAALHAALTALEATPQLVCVAPVAAPPGPFVGREDAMAALVALLDEEAPLITVWGMGGVGKTRLVRQLAWAERLRWPGHTWFCDLTSADDADSVLRAVAAGLELTLAGADPAEAIGQSLAGRGQALVVLDNAEQVIGPLAALVAAWRAAAPRVTFLITSREPLGLADEQLYPLEPLALPAEEGELGGPAYALFVERAREARPGWEVIEEERTALRELLRMLDGLPLAIELAAARVASAQPSQILSRMHKRFELLRSKRRDLTERQATLRGAIDWSWALLPEWGKAALAQLSTFSGSFDLDAAEEVVDLLPWADAPFVMDALEILADKSLLQRRTQGGAARFALLVSVRDYAREKLEDECALRDDAGQPWSGPSQAAAARLRHARYFARMGTPAALAAIHAGRLGQRVEELENLAAAVTGALAAGDEEAAAGAALAAAEILDLRGPFVWGDALCAQVLREAQALSEPSRLRLMLARGRLLWRQGKMDEARSALEAVCASGNARLCASARGYLGMLLGDCGEVERAAELLQEALSGLVGERDSAHEQALFMLNAALLKAELGQIEQAILGYEEALARARVQENLRIEGLARANIATMRYYQGRFDEAERGLQSALVLARRVGDRRAEGAFLGNLSFLYRQQGRFDEAQRGYEAGLALARRVGDRATEGVVLGNIADLARARGDREAAREGMWAALEVARQRGEPRWIAYWMGELGALLGELGQGQQALELLDEAERLVSGLGERLRLARVWTHRAYVWSLLGERAQARRALEDARGLLAQLSVAPEADLVDAMNAVQRRLEVDTTG